MLACRKGHLETVKVLLENGANVDKAKEVAKMDQLPLEIMSISYL